MREALKIIAIILHAIGAVASCIGEDRKSFVPPKAIETPKAFVKPVPTPIVVPARKQEPDPTEQRRSESEAVDSLREELAEAQSKNAALATEIAVLKISRSIYSKDGKHSIELLNPADPAIPPGHVPPQPAGVVPASVVDLPIISGLSLPKIVVMTCDPDVECTEHVGKLISTNGRQSYVQFDAVTLEKWPNAKVTAVTRGFENYQAKLIGIVNHVATICVDGDLGNVPSVTDREDDPSPVLSVGIGGGGALRIEYLPQQMAVSSAGAGRVLARVHGKPWCAPCQTMKTVNGVGDHRVELEYTEEDPPKIAVLNGRKWEWVDIGVVPVITWRDADDKLIYLVGYHTTDQIWESIQRNNPPKVESGYAATGPAGSIHASGQIKQAFTWWKQYIGDKKATFRWDRTGAQTFPLLAKGDWSAKALFGEYGRFQLAAPGITSLPVDSIGFGYKVNGHDMVFDLDPITLAGLADRLGPQQAVGASPVGCIDPLTAWTVLSIVRDIWSLLHPSADLQLGGNVSASAAMVGDTLAIDFSECPSVKLTMLFTFMLKVNRVEISESKVRLVFSGSRWIRERTFAVQ